MLNRIFTPDQINRLRANGEEDYYGNHSPVALLRNPFGPGVWLFTALWLGSDERLWALADLGAGEPDTGDVELSKLAEYFTDLGYLPESEPDFDPGLRPLSQFLHQGKRDGAVRPHEVLQEPEWTFEPRLNDDHIWRDMEIEGPQGRQTATVLALYYLVEEGAPLNMLLLCRSPEGRIELYEHAADGLHYRGEPDAGELARLHQVQPDQTGILDGRAVSRSDDDDLSDYVRFNTLQTSGRANLD